MFERIKILLKKSLPQPARRFLLGVYLRLRLYVPRFLPQNLILAFKVALTHKYIIAYWWTGVKCKNFGDALNPVIIELLSGKKVVHSNRIINFTRKQSYYVIGSILRSVRSSTAVIWGSGFIDSKDTVKKRPREVRAVRGPLTRKKLLELGIECPEIYGDPALLCPLFFKPAPVKRYALGIVPHFVDWNSPLLDKFRTMPNVTIIDITSGVTNVIEKVTECEAIASSALHGLILADAYRIPSVWIKISGKLAGDDFKFYDYFQSVGRNNIMPIRVTSETTIDDLLPKEPCKIRIDLLKLLKSCPFLEKVEILKRFEGRYE